ncbi:MAG: arginine--tRNA ligase [Candidatus Micrarchaeota archaeon]
MLVKVPQFEDYARALLEEEARELVVGALGRSSLAEPRDASFGVLSDSSAFRLAGELKKKPDAIAGEAAAKINAVQGRHFINCASAVGGFVNFQASDAYYALAVKQACRLQGDFGKNGLGKGKVFTIDYSDPNVGKPFHIGHIRSTILGASILRLKRACGWQAHGYTWLGDSGTQVAKLIVALDEFKDLPAAADERALLEYYKRIHAEIDARPELAEKARKVQELLEQGDAETLGKAEKIRIVSLRGFQANWRALGLAYRVKGSDFEVVTGESAFIKAAVKRVGECVKAGVAFVDKEGETVLRLEPHGLPNTVLMRSNGTTLYITRDIAREDWAFKKWKYDESLVITASEQDNHFRQWHKTVELLGRPYAGKLRHVGFGLVFLEGGKISSREGRVVFLDDVLHDAVDAARKQLGSVEGQDIHGAGGVKTSHNVERIIAHKASIREDELDGIARTVGVGSLKFAFLRVGSEKNITFNPATAVSFEGDTGAYVQYTCVRARNILRKAGKLRMPGEMQGFNDAEKNVAGLAASFPQVVNYACNGLQPHALCDYSLKLSAAFSAFYENCPVLTAAGKEREKRLAITRAVAATLENCLALLDIGVPERM